MTAENSHRTDVGWQAKARRVALGIRRRVLGHTLKNR